MMMHHFAVNNFSRYNAMNKVMVITIHFFDTTAVRLSLYQPDFGGAPGCFKLPVEGLKLTGSVAVLETSAA